MHISEGQIYEGTVSISGAPDDRLNRWIVVAPFGRTHIHSLGTGDRMQCWPLSVIITGLQEGTVRLVGEEPQHPILQLQRAKEAHGIVDAHLGLNGERLEKMLALLQQAVSADIPYAPYAAAEITTLLDRSLHDAATAAQVRNQVRTLLLQWRGSVNP